MSETIIYRWNSKMRMRVAICIKSWLSPKQKKAREKAARAKQARKVNYKYQKFTRFQVKRLKKAKIKNDK